MPPNTGHLFAVLHGHHHKRLWHAFHRIEQPNDTVCRSCHQYGIIDFAPTAIEETVRCLEHCDLGSLFLINDGDVVGEGGGLTSSSWVGVKWKTAAWPRPTMPKFCDEQTASLSATNGLNCTPNPLPRILNRIGKGTVSVRFETWSMLTSIPWHLKRIWLNRWTTLVRMHLQRR